MTPTFRLGRIAGVEIGVNWTWLIVVVLVAWSLADGVFPETCLLYTSPSPRDRS